MQPVSDGVYEVLVVDVEEDDEEVSTKHFEVVITTGARKGEVVRVRATQFSRDALAFMGLPATLTVSDGQPHLAFDA